MSVACAVLAAGGSARLGTPKQLLMIDGRTLIARVVAAACASRCEHVAVVLGAHAPAVSAALPSCRATTLLNPQWSSEGMSSTMHTAVRWAQRVDATALLLAACDQPDLTVRQLDALVTAFQRERCSVASRYGAVLGVPALIEAKHFERLLAIEGDRGAAPLLRGDIALLAVDWPEGAVDLDTPRDVARLRAAGRA